MNKGYLLKLGVAVITSLRYQLLSPFMVDSLCFYSIDCSIDFFQFDKEEKSIFGWSLEHQYTKKSLENGINALKGKDYSVLYFLDEASKRLPTGKQFSFYIVKFNYELSENGRHEYGAFICKFLVF